MSDKIIDFSNVKNKVKESDVDKFEDYLYNLYYSVMDGSMSMVKFSSKVMDYMKENDISQEKFMKIQTKFMERYGFSGSDIEKELKKFGPDSPLNNIGKDDISDKDLENIKNGALFYERHKDNLSLSTTTNIKIVSDKNDVTVCLDKENVIIYSIKNIDLSDKKLNDFILSYKTVTNKELKVTLCSNCIKYTY